MAFNAEAFLETAIQGENSTTIPVLPEGEYVVEITDLKLKETKNPLYVLVQLETLVDSPEAAEFLGRKESPFKFNFSFVVEIDETSGALNMGNGKNILIGQLRAAVGQNNKAKPWKFTDLVGNQYLFKVGEEVDKNNSEIIRNRINAVASVDNMSTDV